MNTRQARTAHFLTAFFLTGLCLMSGCKKQANQPTNLPVANLGSPVRVSSGDSDAAEPDVECADLSALSYAATCRRKLIGFGFHWVATSRDF